MIAALSPTGDRNERAGIAMDGTIKPMKITGNIHQLGGKSVEHRNRHIHKIKCHINISMLVTFIIYYNYLAHLNKFRILKYNHIFKVF